MGRRRKRKAHERDIDGIVLLDKPAGITSNAALQSVRNIYRAAKGGHTGSLDKPATGMLPLCLGIATKLSHYLLNADKSYRVEARLGATTTTGDAAGRILKTETAPALDRRQLERVISRFVGRIEQIPPMYSAIKINGQRLYKLAYQNHEIERPPRTVTIHRVDLIDFDRSTFTLRVSCSKGVYIRVLIEDIGKVIGCGAHVTSLRRLSVGPFKEEQMVTLERIKKTAQDDHALRRLLLQADCALEHLDTIELSKADAKHFCRGWNILLSPASAGAGLRRVYDQTNSFLGVGKLREDGVLSREKLMCNSYNNDKKD